MLLVTNSENLVAIRKQHVLKKILKLHIWSYIYYVLHCIAQVYFNLSKLYIFNLNIIFLKWYVNLYFLIKLKYVYSLRSWRKQKPQQKERLFLFYISFESYYIYLTYFTTIIFISLITTLLFITTYYLLLTTLVYLYHL